MNFESPKAKDKIPEKKPEDKKEVSRRNFLRMAIGGAVASSILAKKAEAILPGEGKQETEQQKGHYLRLKEIIKGKNVHERFRTLKEKFGNGAGEILPLVAFQLLDWDSIEYAMQEEGDREGAMTKENALSLASDNYDRFWNPAAIEKRVEEREKKDGLTAKIEGFDENPVFSNEKLRQEIESKFGKEWAYSNISGFRYVDKPEKRIHFNVGGTAPNRGVQSMFYKHKEQEVVIYQMPGIKPEDLLKVIAHEIGHHQDWVTANCLGLEERLNFLEEVSHRFESTDRFTDSYVDEITPKEAKSEGLDDKSALYRQLKEYWASIVEFYTTDKPVLRTAFPKDFALVDKWHKRILRRFRNGE